MKRLTAVGFIVSILWAGTWTAILVTTWPAPLELTLNEWGDLLAGLTAPLALLWFIVGYFLQSKELSVNTQVLKAQQEELKRQVEETALLAKNSDRQAKAAERALEGAIAERASRSHENWLRTRLRLRVAKTINSAQGQSFITLQNVGEPVTHVSIAAALSDVTIEGGSTLHLDDQFRLFWPTSKPYPVDVILRYVDIMSRLRLAEFQLTPKSELIEQAETDKAGRPIFG